MNEVKELLRTAVGDDRPPPDSLERTRLRIASRRTHRRVAAGALGLLLTAALSTGLVLVTKGTPHHPVSGTRCSLQTATSPNIGTGNNFLYSASAASPNDAWTVGFRIRETEAGNAPLALHWDGSAWSVVLTPAAGQTDFLYGVSELPNGEAWAVGASEGTINGVGHPFALHWDGEAWRVVPAPSHPGAAHTLLQGVAAVSSRDVWAVGGWQVSPGGSYRPLIEHWDGSRWSEVAGPDVRVGQLASVSAVSADDVWAVGTAQSGGRSPEQTLVEHWDGKTWSVVASPNRGTGFNELLSVSALSRDDVWAVGTSDKPVPDLHTLVLHWDGSAWSIVPSPDPSGAHSDLTGVAALVPNNVWAVGTRYLGRHGERHQTLVEHWNGKTWTIVKSPNSASPMTELSGVAGLPGGPVWAAGYHFDGQSSVGGKTLILQGCAAP